MFKGLAGGGWGRGSAAIARPGPSQYQPVPTGSVRVSPAVTHPQVLEAIFHREVLRPHWARTAQDNLAASNALADDTPPPLIALNKSAPDIPPNLTASNALAGDTLPSEPPYDADKSLEADSTNTTVLESMLCSDGVLTANQSKPPENLGDIVSRLVGHRGGAPPPRSMYEKYTSHWSVAGINRDGSGMIPLFKTYDDDKSYVRVIGGRVNAVLEKDRSNDGLTAWQPDYVEGIEKTRFLPFEIDQIPEAALYRSARLPALPHLAGEWQWSEEYMAKVSEPLVRSRYTGAAFVQARNQALHFIGKPDPAGHAEIVTFATDGARLAFYAHYAEYGGADGGLKYHQSLITDIHMTQSYDEFVRGYNVLRNAQDFARERSYALREALVEHWMMHHRLF